MPSGYWCQDMRKYQILGFVLKPNEALLSLVLLSIDLPFFVNHCCHLVGFIGLKSFPFAE